MAELVVQALEVVDVDQRERERLAGAVGALRLARELVLEVAVVVETREAVGERELREHLVRAAQRVVLRAQPLVRVLDLAALLLELAPARVEAVGEVVERARGRAQQPEAEREASRRGERRGHDVDREVGSEPRRTERRRGQRAQELPRDDGDRHGRRERGAEQHEAHSKREAPKPRGGFRVHLSSTRGEFAHS